jgi:ATP-dependent DNA ligase
MPETGATPLAFVSPRILIKLVAQIDFSEWTPDGHLLHSKFVGLRDDKDARWIVREG